MPTEAVCCPGPAEHSHKDPPRGMACIGQTPLMASYANTALMASCANTGSRQLPANSAACNVRTPANHTKNRPGPQELPNWKHSNAPGPPSREHCSSMISTG